MSITHLVVLRHGRTAWNDTGRMQGHADIGLDETGLEQSRAAALALAGRRFVAVYSSDLARATGTAELLAGPLGLPVATDARLREIDMGSWTGRTLDDVVAEFPHFALLYWEGKDYRRSPEGETVSEVIARSEPALREIIDRHRGEEVLVVGHGFMLSQLIQKLVGLEPFARVLGGLGNAHWSEVGVPPDDNAWVISHNVGPHTP